MAMLSRGPQLIGPVYNDLNREARKLKRQGYGKAAEELAFEASKQKLAGGESGITSEMSNRKERDGREVIQRGLSRANRDAVMKGEGNSGVTTAATGDLLTKRQGLYERMRAGDATATAGEAAKLGITDSGFAQASASAAKSPLRTAAPAPASAPSSPSATSGVPILGGVLGAARGLSRPASTPQLGASRPSLIDGKPAALSLKRPADSEPGNMRDIQAREADDRSSLIMAAMGASADSTTSRTRQDVVNEANKARIAAGKAPFDDSIYGEMSKVDSSNAAFDRNERRYFAQAADETASRKLTAGINAAPTPKLDTSFPTPSPSTVATAPTSAPASPISAASPDAPQSTAYYAGLGIRRALGSTRDAIASSMKGPDYSLPENAPSFTSATIKQPKLKPLELSDEAARTKEELKKKALRPALGAGRDFSRGLFTGR